MLTFKYSLGFKVLIVAGATHAFRVMFPHSMRAIGVGSGFLSYRFILQIIAVGFILIKWLLLVDMRLGLLDSGLVISEYSLLIFHSFLPRYLIFNGYCFTVKCEVEMGHRLRINLQVSFLY